jgi:hypothetical protein
VFIALFALRYVFNTRPFILSLAGLFLVIFGLFGVVFNFNQTISYLKNCDNFGHIYSYDTSFLDTHIEIVRFNQQKPEVIATSYGQYNQIEKLKLFSAKFAKEEFTIHDSNSSQKQIDQAKAVFDCQNK